MLIRTVESWFFLLSPRQVDLANNTFTGVQISRTLSARGGGSNNSGNNNLAALNLGFNRIRGYAPTNLRVFPALSFLFIWYNMQHGAIPLEYRQIKSMKRLFLDEVMKDPSSHKDYSWSGGELRRKRKLVIGKNLELRKEILNWLHSSSYGGHSRRDATYQRVKTVVYWKGLSKDVKRFVHQCTTCQQRKYDNSSSPGLLQPLPVPDLIWQHITMDFIEGLPNSFGKQVIFVVVDRLSKAAHFIALQHPYTVADVAQCFMDNIFKLHGCLASITSDRDPIFVSQF